MSNPITPEYAYLLAMAQRSTAAPTTDEAIDLTKQAKEVAKGAIDELADMHKIVDELRTLCGEAFQQRDWAYASLQEFSEAYHSLQEEHKVQGKLLDISSIAHAKSLNQAEASNLRNERHIAKLSKEIQFMQRKLHKRRNRINHLQEVIGTILKERPIVTDYDKMGGAALGRVVHTLSEKYREVCRKEKEEADARERLFQVDIKDSRKLVDALRKQGFNEDAIIEFMQVTKAVNNGQV